MKAFLLIYNVSYLHVLSAQYGRKGSPQNFNIIEFHLNWQFCHCVRACLLHIRSILHNRHGAERHSRCQRTNNVRTEFAILAPACHRLLYRVSVADIDYTRHDRLNDKTLYCWYIVNSSTLYTNYYCYYLLAYCLLYVENYGCACPFVQRFIDGKFAFRTFAIACGL